jgi:CubicO group peptidase (beta-lactamase class C family)
MSSGSSRRHQSRLVLPFLFAASFLSCAAEAPRAAVPYRSLPGPAPSCAAAESVPRVANVDPSGHWDVRWDRAFAGDFSEIGIGSLDLTRAGDSWTGTLTLPLARPASFTFDSLRIDGASLDATFLETVRKKKFQLRASIQGRRMIGEARIGDDDDDWTPISGRSFPSTELHAGAVDHSFPPLGVGKSEINAAALATILEHARSENSSAIVIVKDGKIAVEQYRDGYAGGPLLAMSGSKSVTELAIGLLVGEGKLSLETPMGALFPEWRAQGKKGEITIRHLLSHMSGLDPSRAGGTGESIRLHAEKAKLVTPPGTRFQYNNGAVDFLAVVVKQVSGVQLDEYLEDRMFKRLDIVGAHWMKDDEGTPLGAGELFIRPVDLAKIGQMLLDGGKWRGEQILSPDWIKMSIAASQPFEQNCGLLFWREGTFAEVITAPLLDWWRETGADAAVAERTRPLVGKRFESVGAVKEALEKKLGAPAFKELSARLQKGDHVPFSYSVEAGPVTGYSARGWLGQYLVVLPKTGIVAVRMRDAIYSDYDGGKQRHGYDEFRKEVPALFQ